MEKQSTIKIGLLGIGTVGRGFYEQLKRQAGEMRYKTGVDLEIAKILVRDITKPRAGIDPALLTDSWEEIKADDSIQIVVELMGGIESTKLVVLEALQAGKHVVTANKDLLAVHGQELMEEASKYGCDLRFEAAVAGGIPIIAPLKHSLVGNEIDEVVGIVNGTTNYILTKMFEENMDFKEALQKATELGYAEAEPAADIEGLDAGRKMAILASLAFHTNVVFSDAYIEGITKISSEDIKYAKEFDSVIKLLGVARNTKDGIEVFVRPMLLSVEHPLSAVRKSFNAVFVHGDALGDAMFYGKGAGAFPTASSVIGDVIEVARNIVNDCAGRESFSGYRTLLVKAEGEIKNKFFLRMQVDNYPGVLAKIAKVFGDHKVSIAKVIQKSIKPEQAELVIVTEHVKEYHMKNALQEIEQMEIVREISSVICEY